MQNIVLIFLRVLCVGGTWPVLLKKGDSHRTAYDFITFKTRKVSKEYFI